MVGFPWKYSREPTFVETAIMAPLFSRYVRPALLRAALSCIAMLTVVAPAAAQDLPYAQGRLWMVEVAGAAPSFLVGTMHSADPAVATPWPALAHVMDAVDSVTVELVLDDEATKAMGQAMVLTDGRVLGDIAGPDRMAHIEAVGAMYGMPPEALQQFRPWAVNMLFSLPPSELQRQATGAAMLDNVLRQHAEDRGIAVYGIETIAEQLALFADYSEADQLAMLDLTLEMQPRVEAQFAALRNAWLAGDLGGLYDTAMDLPVTESPELVDEFMGRLIQDRNHRMAERITGLLDQGNALIAVGALHLPGDEGVLALLEAKGYLVSPVAE
jgi:uncharacterized protein YbaP (TraB family)